MAQDWAGWMETEGERIVQKMRREIGNKPYTLADVQRAYSAAVVSIYGAASDAKHHTAEDAVIHLAIDSLTE